MEVEETASATVTLDNTQSGPDDAGAIADTAGVDKEAPSPDTSCGLKQEKDVQTDDVSQSAQESKVNASRSRETEAVAATRESIFFYEVIFLRVSNSLFAIPKRYLNVTGTTFANMFRDGTPVTSAHDIAEGSHHTNPIVLHGIDLEQFQKKPLWIQGIGKTVYRWLCNGTLTRLEAKKEVHKNICKQPFKLVELGKRFQYEDWVVQGYTLLVDPGFMARKPGDSTPNLPSNGSSATLNVNESYYDQDFFYEPLFLKVSNRLFCVPREHLDIPGTAFALMFVDGTPSRSADGVEGSNRGNPVVLEGIDLEEFRGFLKAAWRREKYPLTTTDWINALGLALQWEFDEIKTEAQDNIYAALNRDPFEMIRLGRKFKIRSWVVRGYSILGDISFMLSAEELAEKGMANELSGIWKIREAL
ncbi:hypothetical protein CVT24_001686, partial [Panaeolus cyanescens]